MFEEFSYFSLQEIRDVLQRKFIDNIHQSNKIRIDAAKLVTEINQEMTRRNIAK